MVKRGRRPSDEVSPKQLEVYELILNHVREYGYQPTLTELATLLDVRQPAVRQRIEYLVEKGLFKPVTPKSERAMGFVGLKFLPYQVDSVSEKLVEEQQIDMGDYVATIRRKATK